MRGGSLRVTAALVLGWPSAAQAEAAQPFQLDYSAPPACPDRASFVAAVMRRVPSARETSAGAALRLQASFSERKDGTAGVLVVERDGMVTRREISAAPCAEVADSMALMVAVLLDEAARASSVATPNVPAAPDSQPEQSEKSGPNVQIASAPNVPPARPKPTVAQRRREAALEPNHERKAYRLDPGLAAAFNAETGVVDPPLPALAIGFDAWLRRPSWISPSLRVLLVYGQTRFSTPYGRVDFRLITSRTELCPLRSPGSWLSLRACAEIDLGQLYARGVTTPAPQRQSMFWLGTGAGVRAETPLLDQLLTLEAGVNARVMWHHDPFQVEPDYRVHQVPLVAMALSLGARARFP